MTIEIRKDEFGIKFYSKHDEDEPLITIYNETNIAMVRDVILDTEKAALCLMQAIGIASIFILAMDTPDESYKKNFIDTIYISELDQSTIETKYSPRKVLNWLESESIITVNKKDRIKYQFTSFGYSCGKLIISYKPVVW